MGEGQAPGRQTCQPGWVKHTSHMCGTGIRTQDSQVEALRSDRAVKNNFFAWGFAPELLLKPQNPTPTGVWIVFKV